MAWYYAVSQNSKMCEKGMNQMDYKKEIGQRIKKVRNEKGITAAQLGEMTGFAPNHIYAIESGKDGVSVEGLILIAQKLDVSVDYLVDNVRTENPEKVDDILNEIADLVEKLRKNYKK